MDLEVRPRTAENPNTPSVSRLKNPSEWLTRAAWRRFVAYVEALSPDQAAEVYEQAAAVIVPA